MEKNEARIELTGWLNNVNDFNWGRAFSVAVDVRRRNDSGDWETVDKTAYDVTTDDKSGDFSQAKQVKVLGRITGLNTYEKRDGSTGVSVKVRAESVAAIDGGKVSEAAIMETWPTAKIGQATAIDVEAPF